MSLTLAQIRTRLRVFIADEAATGITQEFTDADLLEYVSSAVEKYSDFRPHRIHATLTTVAQQSDYALPAAALAITRVDWTPSALYGSFVGLGAAFYQKEWQDDALLAVRDQLLRNVNRATQTSWAEVNYESSYTSGRYVRLYPAPQAAGDHIDVWYTSLHPLNAGSTGYDTIPANHLNHIAKLASAVILLRKARQLVMLPDITQGNAMRLGSDPGRVLLNEATYLDSQVEQSLSDPISGRS